MEISQGHFGRIVLLKRESLMNECFILTYVLCSFIGMDFYDEMSVTPLEMPERVEDIEVILET